MSEEGRVPSVVRTVTLRDPGLPVARLHLLSDGDVRWCTTTPNAPSGPCAGECIGTAPARDES